MKTSTLTWFVPGGNYHGGVSVPDCMLNGFEKTEKVTQYL